VNTRPSRTAQYMALFRAIESAEPSRERLFTDPFAAAFLTGPLKIASTLRRFSAGRRAITNIIDRKWPGPRPSAILRTKIIDDALAQSLLMGVAQVVILGAGFDSRAYRIPEIAATRVFELDLPPTQRAKLGRLKRHPQGARDHVTYVPIDFERADLADVLEQAGFRTDRIAAFVWEGVTNYLTARAVDHTIRTVARIAAPDSRLIFTYVHRGVLDGSVAFDEADRWASAVRARGEPWTFGFDPAEVGQYLHARGFTLVEDRSMLEASNAFITHGTQRLQGSALYHVAVAQRDSKLASKGGSAGDE